MYWVLQGEKKVAEAFKLTAEAQTKADEARAAQRAAEQTSAKLRTEAAAATSRQQAAEAACEAHQARADAAEAKNTELSASLAKVRGCACVCVCVAAAVAVAVAVRVLPCVYYAARRYACIIVHALTCCARALCHRRSHKHARTSQPVPRPWKPTSRPPASA